MNERRNLRHACAEFADRLVDLSDGDLPANERVAVEAHVANCDLCREQLQRLDVSLAELQSGIVPAAPVAVERNRRFARTAVWIAVGSTAAAILLAIGITSFLKAPTHGPGESVVVKAPTSGRGESPSTSAISVSTEDALRQIALLEQEARLETSLALMPDDPWFADQRAANEHLLSMFREAAAAGVNNQSPQSNPRSKETL